MADVSPVQAFTLLADSAYLSKRPLPTAPDGYYDWQITSDPADKREGHSTVTNLVNRVSRSFKVLRSTPSTPSSRCKLSMQRVDLSQTHNTWSVHFLLLLVDVVQAPRRTRFWMLYRTLRESTIVKEP